jgi:hypothetical protein
MTRSPCRHYNSLESSFNGSMLLASRTRWWLFVLSQLLMAQQPWAQPAASTVYFVEGQQSHSKSVSLETLRALDSLSTPKIYETGASNPCDQTSNISRPDDKAAESVATSLATAESPQEILFVLSRGGRAEVKSVKTIEMVRNLDLPHFVAQEFSEFYANAQNHSTKAQKKPYAILEFFGRLPKRRYKGLETFTHLTRLRLSPDLAANKGKLKPFESSQTKDFEVVFTTQKALAIRPGDCAEAKHFLQNQSAQQEIAASNLAKLTNRPLTTIRARMNINHKTGDRKGADWWNQPFR